jgi:hypothetical protein
MDLEINPIKYKEDSFTCRQIIDETGKCSYEELQKIKNDTSYLSRAGYVENFYNELPVHSLTKPVHSFISGLNQFFIAALLSGPSIFLAYVKIKVDNKMRKKREEKNEDKSN